MIGSLLLSFLLAAQSAAPKVGPASGALVVDGGGETAETIKRFVALAGGPESPIVLIPTASESEHIDLTEAGKTFMRRFGVKRVTVLHTRDKAEADREDFVAPLKEARGVWFGGGRQWRLVDAYLGTRTQREIESVLARGGVVGGSSAGATIQGSYLLRGAREGNHIMMAKGYEQGFGYLKGVTVDQHLLVRRRQDDLVEVIEKKPELLGLGLDEQAAIVVRGDRMEVIGRSVVGIYDGKDHDGKRYYFLAPGEVFDLAARRRVEIPSKAGDRPGDARKKAAQRPPGALRVS
jgi:cyanophycinase